MLLTWVRSKRALKKRLHFYLESRSVGKCTYVRRWGERLSEKLRNEHVRRRWKNMKRGWISWESHIFAQESGGKRGEPRRPRCFWEEENHRPAWRWKTYRPFRLFRGFSVTTSLLTFTHNPFYANIFFKISRFNLCFPVAYAGARSWPRADVQ